MTSTPRPRNATPQKLLLKPPQVPRMPFSSPMGEEILSPTSDPSHTPPQEQRETRQGSGKRAQHQPQRNESRRKSIGERRFSISRPSKGEWGTDRTDSPSRSKWPGLNVITDFTKGADAVTNMSKPQVQPLRIAEKRPKQETGVTQAPDPRKRSQDSLRGRQDPRLGHKRSGRSLKGSGSKGRLDDLKRASTKSSNLSPSDRAVVIGISVDPDEVVQNESPGTEQSLNSAHNAQERRLSLTPSIAPSIVVTPANEHGQAPWSSKERDQASPPRGRPASSVYSHLPAPREKMMNLSMVPPVPAIPPTALRANAQNENHSEKVPRVTSNCTIFDEEPSPDAVAQFRPGSRDSQVHILEKIGTRDTVITKRQSQGWWNVIRSPFFPKSPMTLRNQQSIPDDDKPLRFGLTKASLPGHNRDDMSPGSPPRYQKSQAAESAHTSWTDSSLEAECEKRALDFGEPTNAAKSLNHRPQAQMPRESYYTTERFEGLGAASDYYEACLYDMHSSMPYFECQNHKCRPSTLGIGGYVARGVDGPEAPPVVRGIPLDAWEVEESKVKGEPLKPPGPQAPANRFSAAFGEVVDKPKVVNGKHQSEATVIEDLDATPDIQEAKAAPVMKAPEPVPAMTPPVRKDSLARRSSTIYSSPFFNKPDPTPKDLPTPPPRLPNKNSPRPDHRSREAEPETPRKPWVGGLPSNPRHKTLEHPMSPQPLTPGAQNQAPRGGIPLTQVHESREPSPDPSHAPQHTYVTNHYYQHHSKRTSQGTTTTADLWPPPRPPRPAEGLESWHTKERQDLPPRESKKSMSLAKLKACIQRKRKHRQTLGRPMDKKKKRRILFIIGVGLLLLIILVLVLAMTLTHRGDKMSAESQWLNITGYPPVPTGISTIAQPDAAQEESGCVQPKSMWSCALPKEEQQGIAPNAPNQPNFRVEIRFQNGTNATVGNISSLDTRSLTPSNPTTAGRSVRFKLRRLRRAFISNSLYSPDPSPPSDEDQTFLGNSTDSVHAPFDGEYTPFFMTFHSSAPLPSRLFKRKVLETDNNDDTSNSNDSFPDIASSIPGPSTNPDGTAAPAQLYPYPSAQPLRLFNRGRPDEHYGFYTYFSRSLFLKSTTPLNASIVTGNTPPSDPADNDGGAEQREASVRCTWTQTRFLVQIWTKKGDAFPLLQGNVTSSSPIKNDHSNKNSTHGKNATESSANDFARPGSFPYPISITLDRHGGDISKKMIYCYGLDNDAKPINDAKKLQLEDREFGGTLVNGAKGPWKDVKVKTKDGGPGGIDGGSGGCGCRWQNFE